MKPACWRATIKGPSAINFSVGSQLLRVAVPSSQPAIQSITVAALSHPEQACKTCDENVDRRWFVFDRRSQIPLVNRAFPKNSRAALSPDENHYASFEANELRIYSLGASK
jgi:hypothetical protein